MRRLTTPFATTFLQLVSSEGGHPVQQSEQSAQTAVWHSAANGLRVDINRRGAALQMLQLMGECCARMK
jgi:hypothetical protein